MRRNIALFVVVILFLSIIGFLRTVPIVRSATTLCSTTSITITQTSSPIIYIDNDTSPLLDSVYVSYQVDTGGSDSFNDLWVKLEDFSSANLTLAANEDGLYHIGPMNINSTEHVYLYLTGTETASSQSYNMVLYDGHPSFGGTETCYSSKSHTSVDDTIKAVSNKVTSVVSTAPYVGGSMTITVTGDTGTIGAAGIFNYIPASVSTWPADCYELNDTQMVLSGGNTGTFDDGLYLSGLNSSNTHYVQTYWLTAKCTTAVDTPVTPLNNISSGTQIKHTSTDTSTYTSIPPIPPAENQVNMTKSVSPGGSASGGSATYTVTLYNDSPVSITLDYFQDTLPSSPATVSYTTSSSEWNAISISNPNIVGQQLTWTDNFTVPANSSRDLTYDVTIPSTNGNYANSVIGFVGNTQIDLTKDTTDNTPATSTYGVGDPNFGTSLKTSVDLNAGDLVPGDTIRYTLTLVNSGTISATGVDISDTIDSNTENLSNIVISASGSNCGSSYTDNSTTTLLAVIDLEIQVGTNCIITFDTAVKSGTPDQTSILNSAVISASAEGGVGGNPASTPLTVDVDPNLTLSKTENDADNNVSPGQVVTYSVTIGNTGLADGTGIDLIDSIGGSAPIAVIDNFTFTNCGSDYVNNSSGTNIDIPNLDVATALDCIVTYDVAIDGAATDTQTITNNADVGQANEGGNDPGPVSASTLTVVVSGTDPVLTVSKTDNDTDNVVSPGQTVTYTVTIGNTGNETGTTSFTDTVDSDFGSPSNFGFTNCGCSEGTSFTAPTLTVSTLVVTTSSDCIVTYDLSVDDPLNEGTTINNSVDVAQAAEGGNDPNPVTADLLTVDSTPDLSGSTKTENDADNTVTPGQTITYTLTIINSGDGLATGVDITDNIDGNSTLDTGSVGFANCGSSYTDNSISSQLNIVTVDIAVGVNCVITFDITIENPSTESATIPNSATISTSDEGGSGGNPSSTTLTIDITPNLTVTKTENDVDNIAVLGQSVTYTVTIQNTGNGTANTSFTDTVDSDYSSPTNVTYTSCGTPSDTFVAPSFTVSGLTITTIADCVVTYDLIVGLPNVEGGSLLNSVDVAQATEGGNNPAPVAASVLSYESSDGIDTATEDASPNQGDGNNDGTNDSIQPDVTSFVNPVTNSYAVLENSGSCVNANVSQVSKSSLSASDGDYTYPVGLMNFELICGTPGVTVTVTQYYFGDIDASKLVARKYSNINNTYSTIVGAVITNEIIDNQKLIKIVYQITDGGNLDEDGTANGTIVDPVGPAIVPGLPITGSQPSFLLIIGLLLLTGFSLRNVESKK